MHPRARLLIAIVLSLWCLNAHARTADAAMWLRITTDPVSPRVGQIVRVSVATMVASTNHCVDDPRQRLEPWSNWFGSSGPVHEFNFKLKAEREGSVIDIPLSRRDSEPAHWDGAIVFPTAGVWVVRMTYPEWSDEACAGARIDVRVRESNGLPAASAELSATSSATPEALIPLLSA